MGKGRIHLGLSHFDRRRLLLDQCLSKDLSLPLLDSDCALNLALEQRVLVPGGLLDRVRPIVRQQHQVDRLNAFLSLDSLYAADHVAVLVIISVLEEAFLHQLVAGSAEIELRLGVVL